MKKTVSILLLAAMMLGICACSPQQGEQATTAQTDPTETTGYESIGYQAPDQFSVGYDRLIMNPETSVPLQGYGNELTRFATDITEDICTTAMAISDGEGQTVILINTDLIQAQEELVAEIRENVTKATGIPGNQVVVSATHTHSAPSVSTNHESVERYKRLVVERVTQSALNALQDLKPATVSIGSIETENMNFVRHYTLENAVGEISYAGDNFGDTADKTFIGHVSQADPTLHVVKFSREGGENIVAVNWRAHPHFTGGSQVYNMSSDYVGAFRTAFEDQTGDKFIFFQGAAGNINEKSRINAENRTTENRTYGALMAQYTIDCLDQNMTQVDGGTIQITTQDVYGEINKSQDYMYYTASAVAMVWAQTNDKTLALNAAGTDPIRSPYHANAIVANHSRTKENDGKLELTAISVGDALSFVTFPGEAFDTISVTVEEGSPYDMTMFIGYANHHIGYLPNRYAWTYTSYETDITRFEEGTDELVQNTLLEMLDSLSK